MNVKQLAVHNPVNNPTANNGASILQRYRAVGYVTLAAVAKYACKHAYLGLHSVPVRPEQVPLALGIIARGNH